MAGHRVTKLVVETDFHSDVDDVGALALAHRLADRGMAELLAVTVNTPSVWGPAAVRAVNESYGRPGIPVGAVLPGDDSVFELDYARAVVERFGSLGEPEPAVAVLRRSLASADDGAVTLVSIGFFGNLCALLASGPDGASPLNGLELVKRKIGRTVVMGGTYPTGREFNFAADPGLTREFLARWPVSLEFVGWETGNSVLTGGTEVLNPANPAGYAYELYCGPGVKRESWDLIAVHAAVAPESGYYAWSRPGHARVEADGSNRWHDDPTARHRVITVAIPEHELASTIDGLLRY